MALFAGLMAYYGSIWHQLGSQWKVLKRVEATVGDVTTLRPKISAPEKPVSILHWPVHFAFGSDRVSTLRADKEVDFGDWKASDESIELVLQVPNLARASFGEDALTMAAFDRLTENGIEVSHWGLSDFTLSDNYVFVSQFHKLDPDKLQLCGILWTAKSSVEYFVQGPTVDHKYASQHLLGTIQTCEFGKGLDWKQLEMRQFKPQFTDGDNHGNFYDGLHSRLDKHEIDIVSRDKNVFRLKWRFNSEFGGASHAEFEAPFNEIQIVKRSGIKSIAEAKEILSRQFDLSDFEEPIEDEGGWLSYRFVLKPEFRKQE